MLVETAIRLHYLHTTVGDFKDIIIFFYPKFAARFGYIYCKITKRYNSIQFVTTNPRISKPRVGGSNPLGAPINSLYSEFVY